MPDILDEVLYEAKEKRNEKIYEQIISLAIISVVVVLIAIVGYSWYNNRKLRILHEEGGAYIESSLKVATQDLAQLHTMMQEDVATLENLAKNGTTIYSALAALKHASILAYQNKFEEAATQYQLAMNKAEATDWLVDYAAFMKINSQLMGGTITISETIKQLEDYIRTHRTFEGSAEALLLTLFLENQEIEKAKALSLSILQDNSKKGSVIKDIAKFLGILYG